MNGDVMLQNLRIVASIQPNEKLSTLGAVFSVYQASFSSSILRRWYGDDRQANAARVGELYNTALLACRNAEHENRAHAVHMLSDLLRTSLEGLHNLKITYQKDVSTAAMIDVCIERVLAYVGGLSAASELPSPQRASLPGRGS